MASHEPPDLHAAADRAPDATNGAFLVSRDGAFGLSHKQTRSRRYVTPSRGVRIDTTAPDQQLARISAARLACGPRAVVTDLDAALLWGLPLPPWIAFDPGRPVSVSLPVEGAHSARRQVRGRRLLLPPGHLVSHHDIPLTSPGRTWLDCAEFLPPPHLVALGDAALRRGLTSPRDLGRLVQWGWGRRGITTARLTLPHLDAGSESPGESLVRAHLVLDGIPRPECNVDITDRGQWLARVDLAWPSARLIVEYDGAVHLSEHQRRSDAARRNLLQDASWLVIVFTAADLAKPWHMSNLVRAALRQRTPQTPR